MGSAQQQNPKLTPRNRWSTVLVAAAVLAAVAALASLAPSSGVIPASATFTSVTLSPSTTTPSVGQTVTFTAAATSGATITGYTFFFGDGSAPVTVTTAATTAVVPHAYAVAGNLLRLRHSQRLDPFQQPLGGRHH